MLGAVAARGDQGAYTAVIAEQHDEWRSAVTPGGVRVDRAPRWVVRGAM
jgi:hypothetical protein